jgi:uncharacterized protein (TIGR03437 family)
MKALVSRCVSAAVCLAAFSSALRADTSYPVSINLFTCPISSGAGCTQPGTLAINGIVYTTSTMLNFPAGATLTLVATNGTGYVFGGWGSLAGVSSQTASATVTVSGPLSITPVFSPANTVSVRILTQPAGLQVSVDGTQAASATQDWAWFTNHTLAAASPQKDANGKWWVFVGWSDGGSASHTVAMKAGMVTFDYVARFEPGVPVDIVSHPPNMHLNVDGADCVQCEVIWSATQTHTLTAAAQQTDDKGLSYRFLNWSDGSAGPSKVVVPFVLPDRMQLAATFDRLGVITLDSNPGGVRLLVDDGDCYTPCQLQKPLGKTVTVKAPAQYNTGYGTRVDFVSWSAGAGSTMTFQAGADPQLARATFKSMRQIVAAVTPDEGAKVVLDPPSPDGFYDANTTVNVSLVPQPGFRFEHWDGDFNGNTPAGWLTMGVPRQVVAQMHPIPFLPPHAVRNAATDTHGDSVAACSIVTISGIHLATASLSVGGGQPRQFLADTGVRMGDSYLPLYAVSPTEISTQLPCNLPEGTNSLIVHAGYEPEVSTDFTVVRNAPGLFTQPLGGQSYALATHADGSPVTPDNPAVDGETVSVFGTGFGPLQTVSPDGGGTPASSLIDPLEALLGTSSLPATYTGGAGTQQGMDAVQVKVSANGSSVFKVRVNGQDSNAVTLPVAQ